MDDTTTLVSELLNKLAELDQKVCDYRQEMAQEFQRYSHNLLKDAPGHVSVREVIAEELHNYSALSPALVTLDSAAADLGGCSDAERQSRRGSPPPVLPHTSGVPPNDASSGSPPDRDRDREFHGLFTPSYLPLLEVTQPNKTVSSPPVDASPPNPPGDNESNITQDSSLQTPLDITPSRPAPIHHLTEETMSSIHSDDSISHTRKSALRRSSTGSTKDILSPRRVRFDVEGEEVLPTASPPVSPGINELLISPPDTPVVPVHESLNLIAPEDEASILGNSPPRPKKISSTERLKALARSSTEDTSEWTVVGDTHDDDEDEDGLVMFASKKKSHASFLEPVPTTLLKNGVGSGYGQTEQSKDLTKNIYNNHPLIDDEMTDDVLDMTPLSSFKDKKRFSPPKHAQFNIAKTSQDETRASRNRLQNEANSPQSALLSQTHRDKSFEEEELFDFDDDSAPQSQSTRTASKYIQEEVEEDPEVDVERPETTPTDSAHEKSPITLYSTSPAIPMAKPASPTPVSPSSSHPKLVSTSVGSYKGKPFTIGVVRDEDLHQKAAEMGKFSTFVGSVDGRSGVDASDSYRRDAYSFTGSPRSLGEKLMEEAYAARRLAGNVRRQD